MNYVAVTCVGHKRSASPDVTGGPTTHCCALGSLHCAVADAALRVTMRRKLKLFERMFSPVSPRPDNTIDQEPRRVPHRVEMLGSGKCVKRTPGQVAVSWSETDAEVAWLSV